MTLISDPFNCMITNFLQPLGSQTTNPLYRALLIIMRNNTNMGDLMQKLFMLSLISSNNNSL